MHDLIIYCDGSSPQNPGPASYAVVVVDRRGGKGNEIITARGEFLENATNNEAEYSAFIMALKVVSEELPKRPLILLDSELVVKQFTGEYRCNQPRLIYLLSIATTLARGKLIDVAWIPREKNEAADGVAGLISSRQYDSDEMTANIRQSAYNVV